MKNRIIRAAISDSGATADGHPGEKDYEGYERTAAGGAGTVTTGYSYVSDYPMGGNVRMLGAGDDSLIPDYCRLSSMVHSYGCNILQQLAHIGAATTCENVDVIGPSAMKGPYNGKLCREMTRADIRRVELAFADAAVRAVRSGFDGVEVHAAHKLLISQFLSPAYNHRTDEYGGSDENRARFAAEVCAIIRNAVGRDYPVFFKVNCDDGEENGITTEGFLTACRMLEEAGASALEISGAWGNYRQSTPYFLEQTLLAAKSVQIPVILVGGIRGKTEAERILEETPIQYIAMARPLMENPELIRVWSRNS